MTVSENDDILSKRGLSMIIEGYKGTYVGTALHLWLDEPQEMLLIHAAWMVNMGVDFSKVVEIAKVAWAQYRATSR